MIPGNRDHFASGAQGGEQFAQRFARSVIVHEIAHTDELARLVLIQQLEYACAGPLHSPERHKAAGSALAQLETKVQIGHGQPVFALVKKCKSGIQQHVFCYINLRQ